MSNESKLKLEFIGTPEQLTAIQKALTPEKVLPARSASLLSYSLVEKLVPGISDKHMYEFFGWDEMKAYGGEYSKEEAKAFDKQVDGLLQAYNFIGLKDGFINTNVRALKSSIDGDKLKYEIDFRSYAPLDFFEYIANTFKVKVNCVESLEGNFTHIYIDGFNKKITTKNIDTILKDVNVMNGTISVGLFEPADLLLTAAFYGNEKAINDILANHSITSVDIERSKSNLIELKEGDLYQESPLLKEYKKSDTEFSKKLEGAFDKVLPLLQQTKTLKI